MHRALSKILLFAILVSGTCASWAADGGRRECALGYVNSIFAPAQWPNRSLEEFAGGEPGVLDPKFDHFHLFIAYRRIAGKPLGAQDVERLRVFDPCWNDWSRQYFGVDWNSSSVMAQARGEWDAARRAPGLPTVPERKPTTQSVMGYSDPHVPNCNPDAFRTAARTLRARTAS